MNILEQLQTLYRKRSDAVEAWFGAQRQQAAPFFYNSVDLRHSGTRLVPVDTNLYPAGFNNLSVAARRRASRMVAAYMQEHVPQARRIAMIPENHTRNRAYIDNILILQEILISAGYEVVMASLAATEPLTLEGLSGQSCIQYPIAQVTADAYLLNNDLTGGIPKELEGISAPIFPPPTMGWYRRRKSVHFAAYETLADDFAAHFSIDRWQIAAYAHHCSHVDFKDRQSLDLVAKRVDEVLAQTARKYAEYGISQAPYAFVKADSGTYGMGIMTVRSGEDILELNKKERNKMQVIKEGARVSDLIIQEGIPTIDTVEGKAAEPMIYLIDGLPVGGMYRVNGLRDDHNNLNAAGMEFVGMCDEAESVDISRQSVKECDFRAYGIIAAIAALAAAREHYEEK